MKVTASKELDSLKPGTTYLFLLLITLVGIVLRLYHINYQSLWYDELHSIIPTDPVNSLDSVIQYSKGDQPPFFFIYLYYFFHLFGYNELVGRIACALLGIAAIPVMYSLGKEIKGPAVGLFAALLTAFNYMHIYYSQELRFYSMAFLLTALSFLFLVRAFKNLKTLDFVLYAFFTAALLYTHYYGLVIYGAQVIAFFVLLFFRRDGAFIIRSILSGLLVLVLFIPWLPVVFSDLQISSFWIRMPKPGFLAEYFYYYFGKDAFVVAIFAVLFFYSFKTFAVKANTTPSLRALYTMLFASLLFSYVIPYIKSVIGPPMLYVRYTIVSLPVWFVLIAIGWNEIRNARWRYSISIAVALSMALNLIFIREHYVKIDKQQFREASNLVKDKNSALLPVYSAFSWHFNFYFRDHAEKTYDVNSADLGGVNTFWLLQAEFFSPEEKEEVIGRLGGKFEIIERYPFHKTEALLMNRIKD